MKIHKPPFKAFTLIELLIVIVIIGILATAMIPRIIGMQDKAKYTRVKKDFENFRTTVFMAQINTGKPLKDITRNKCTDCICRSSPPDNAPKDLRNIDSNHPCKIRRRQSLELIALAAGLNANDLVYMELDPRGAPYLLDENEGEHGSDGCSASDYIKTAGPDGVYNTSSDNKGITIAPSGCPGSY